MAIMNCNHEGQHEKQEEISSNEDTAYRDQTKYMLLQSYQHLGCITRINNQIGGCPLPEEEEEMISKMTKVDTTSTRGNG